MSFDSAQLPTPADVILGLPRVTHQIVKYIFSSVPAVLYCLYIMFAKHHGYIPIFTDALIVFQQTVLRFKVVHVFLVDQRVVVTVNVSGQCHSQPILCCPSSYNRTKFFEGVKFEQKSRSAGPGVPENLVFSNCLYLMLSPLVVEIFKKIVPAGHYTEFVDIAVCLR